MIRTLVAATVPVESALPWAVTHSPTFTAADVVAASMVIFVPEPIVTVFCVVCGAALVGLKLRAATTIVDPDTEVTLPMAMAPKPARAGRARREPGAAAAHRTAG